MKHIIVFIALSCLFLFSCTRNELHKSIDDQRNDSDSEELTLFMTTEQVFTSVEMKETFNSSKHSIFSSSAIEQLLAQRMNGIVPVEPSDPPIIDSEEIPIWTFNSIIDTIYTNGEMVYDATFEIINDSDANPILDVIESSVNRVNVPAHMAYRNGILSISNSDRDELYSKSHTEPNMTQYVDSLSHYWQLYEDYLYSQGSAVPGQSSASISNNLVEKSGYNQVGVLASGDLILEKEYDATDIPLSKSIQLSSTRMKSTIICSPDYTKIRQESLSCGDQLLSRTTTTYVLNHDNYKTYLSATALDAPIKVVSQSLIIESGIPKIFTKIEGYSKNITKVHNYINHESYEK